MSGMNFNSELFGELRSRYVNSTEKLSEGTVIKATSYALGGSPRQLAVSSGDYKGKLFRSKEMQGDNNRIRDGFKKDIADIFGGESKIPPSVRAAMKFDTDFDKAGRPLTVRRIRATFAEIEKMSKLAGVMPILDGHIASECAILRLPSLSDKMVADAAAYAEKCSEEVAKAAEKLLLPGVLKNGKVSKAALQAFLQEVVERIDGIKMNYESSGGRTADFRAFCNALQESYLLKGLTRNPTLAHCFLMKSPETVFSNVLSKLGKEFSAGRSEDIFSKTAPTVTVRENELMEVRNGMMRSMSRMLPRMRAHYLLTMKDDQAVRDEVDRIIARGICTDDLNLDTLFSFFYNNDHPEIIRLRDVVMTHVAKRLMDGTLPMDTPVSEVGHVDIVRNALGDHFANYVRARLEDLQLNELLGNDNAYPVPELFKNKDMYAELQQKTRAYILRGQEATGMNALTGVNFKAKELILAGRDDIPEPLRNCPGMVRTLLSHPDFKPGVGPLGFDENDPEEKFVDRMADIAKIASKVIAKSAPPDFGTNDELKTALFATVLKCYMKKNPGMVKKLKDTFPKGAGDPAVKMAELSNKIYNEQKDLLPKLKKAFDTAKKNKENDASGQVYLDKKTGLPVDVSGKNDAEKGEYQQTNENILPNILDDRIKKANSLLSILAPDGPLRGYMETIASEIAKLEA